MDRDQARGRGFNRATRGRSGGRPSSTRSDRRYRPPVIDPGMPSDAGLERLNFGKKGQDGNSSPHEPESSTSVGKYQIRQNPADAMIDNGTLLSYFAKLDMSCQISVTLMPFKHSDKDSGPSQIKEPETPDSDGKSNDSKQPFDICPTKKANTIVLKPSLLEKNKEKRRESQRNTEPKNWSELRNGMVLLKGYLSLSDQIKIVKRCRDLGVGEGGFYQPGYRDGAQLHLNMMCLGKNWDPKTSSYGDQRPLDGAKPPAIPKEFYQLVQQAIKDSHSVIEEQYGAGTAEKQLPSMNPDICIVNFYTTSGRLGLHQDRDESKESIKEGLPVVSFSIGDSAEFLYGNQGDVDTAEKVFLESGDVLVFGGRSRSVFHGVNSIRSNTAPKTLLKDTNLRSGRLNLTFRQY